MPHFTVQKGYDSSPAIELKEGEFLVGREDDCDFVIHKGDVSRHHAKVVMQGKKVHIEDLGSSNGTFVNSTPIKGQVELKHRDIVQIGENVLVFNSEEMSTEMEREVIIPDELMKTTEQFTFYFMTHVIKKLEANIGKVFKGKPEAVRDIILCLLADGHILIEDAPGVGKSILAQALSKSILGTYKRIQFTPDMLPSDITGVSVYDDSKKEFVFMPGPIFGNIILADEINRTTPRTQSSLLECMSESVISIDGRTHVLPKPFFVVATQNPSDYHGTYPLPEPQLDRFLMKISIGYPDEKTEKEILTSQMTRHPINDISYVVKAVEILQCQAQARAIHISEPIKDYIVKIVSATRRHPALATSCSPRASLALMRLSQCLAAYQGRQYVIPKDVRDLAKPVLRHRMTLKLRAQSKWVGADELVDDILKDIPMENEEKR